MSFRLFRVKTVFSDQTEFTGSIRVKPCRPGYKNEFRAVSGQNRNFRSNRVRWVNTGQTMSTRVKNEFRAVSGQNRHFRPKSSLPGQYGSNHVDCHNPILVYSQKKINFFFKNKNQKIK